MISEGYYDVIIIGAGLTGLTTGYYLKQQGVNFKIIDSQPRTGGVINTKSELGFVYEQGPNSGILSNSSTVELIKELSGSCTIEKARSESKKRLILKNGEMCALPSGPLSAIFTPLFSFSDKVKILFEPARKKGNDPNESLANTVLRRLGRSFLDYAIDPFISGVYAGDPEKLITRHAFPKLYKLEQKYGSFIRGTIKTKKKREAKKKNNITRETFSFIGGLSGLTNALTEKIGNKNFALNYSNLIINPTEHLYSISGINQAGEYIELKANKIITTTPAKELPILLPFLDKEKLKKISNLPYAPIIEVTVGFNTWNGTNIDAFGLLIPSKEHRNILGVLFMSSIFMNRAPVGGALLSVFLGGIKKQHLIKASDKEIIDLVKEDLMEILHIKEFNPNLIRIHRYTHAIPQYDINTDERLEALKEIHKQHPKLLLAGNLKDGIGIPDRIKQGKELARLV